MCTVIGQFCGPYSTARPTKFETEWLLQLVSFPAYKINLRDWYNKYLSNLVFTVRIYYNLRIFLFFRWWVVRPFCTWAIKSVHNLQYGPPTLPLSYLGDRGDRRDRNFLNGLCPFQGTCKLYRSPNFGFRSDRTPLFICDHMETSLTQWLIKGS